jgi:hypothetical protein
LAISIARPAALAVIREGRGADKGCAKQNCSDRSRDDARVTNDVHAVLQVSPSQFSVPLLRVGNVTENFNALSMPCCAGAKSSIYVWIWSGLPQSANRATIGR